MKSFTIWVDADACPTLARNIILQTALKKELKVTYVANREIPFSLQSPFFSSIVCPKTSGSADDFIFNNASTEDIVVTRDLPFAKRLIEKKVSVINDRGLVFDSKNIEPLLRDRELNMNLVAIGVNCGKKYNNYTPKDASAFESSFLRLIEQKSI